MWNLAPSRLVVFTLRPTWNLHALMHCETAGGRRGLAGTTCTMGKRTDNTPASTPNNRLHGSSRTLVSCLSLVPPGFPCTWSLSVLLLLFALARSKASICHYCRYSRLSSLHTRDRGTLCLHVGKMQVLVVEDRKSTMQGGPQLAAAVRDQGKAYPCAYCLHSHWRQLVWHQGR